MPHLPAKAWQAGMPKEETREVSLVFLVAWENGVVNSQNGYYHPPYGYERQNSIRNR